MRLGTASPSSGKRLAWKASPGAKATPHKPILRAKHVDPVQRRHAGQRRRNRSLKATTATRAAG